MLEYGLFAVVVATYVALILASWHYATLLGDLEGGA